MDEASIYKKHLPSGQDKSKRKIKMFTKTQQQIFLKLFQEIIGHFNNVIWTFQFISSQRNAPCHG